MKQANALFLLMILMLNACSPQNETQPASSKSSAMTKPHLAASEPKAQSVPQAACTLQKSDNLGDVMQQILANLDNDCLFKGDSVTDLWFHNAPANSGLERELFPELDPNSPDYNTRLAEETQKLMSGQRQISPEALQKIQALSQQNKGSSSIQTFTGQSSSNSRITRHFSFEMPNGAAFDEPFANINTLPENFKQRGKIALPYQPELFILFNSEHNPDKPYIQIRFDEKTGKIHQIEVFENLDDPKRGLHEM